jgi:hypothetical protein
MRCVEHTATATVFTCLEQNILYVIVYFNKQSANLLSVTMVSHARTRKLGSLKPNSYCGNKLEAGGVILSSNASCSMSKSNTLS